MYFWLMRHKLLTLLGTLLCFFSFTAQTDHAPHDARVVSPHASPTLKFTENAGQWDNKILFKAQLYGGGLYLEKNCLTFNFFDQKKYGELHHGGLFKKDTKDFDIKCHAYKVYFENCNTDVTTEKMQEGPDYENYFLGNDKSKWHGNVKNYHQVWLKNLYNNIDYEVLTTTHGIKYNFHVKPTANVADIKLRYEGVDDIKLKDGALILKLNTNGVTEQKPYAYQLINGKVVEVACHYKFKDHVLGFSFPKGYDKNYELVIDPILVFAAQSGSTANNFGMTATYDPLGSLYAGGTAYDNGYPTTIGAYSTSFNGISNGYAITDVVLTKYTPTGNGLIYSTYIGGTKSEVVSSLIVDSNGNLCFYGATGSNNFPITTGAYDNTFAGGDSIFFFSNGTEFSKGTDIYVGKISAGGNSLLASTYLGGSANDGINHVNHMSPTPFFTVEYFLDSLQNNYGDQYRGEIQLDAGNNIYIASSTRSSDFPTVNAFDNTLGGKQDAILAKFNSNLTTLVYCSYVGGNSNDAGNSLIVKNNLEVYMTGGTCSDVGFPGSGPGYQTTYQGGSGDGFVIRVSPSGNTVMNRTFFGTPQYDQSYFVQGDKYDNIYIYGQSLGNIPVLAASNQTNGVFSVPNTHQFISRFDKTLTTLNLSTVFGNATNNTELSPCAFSVDKCLNIYISGWGGDFLRPSAPTLTNMPLFQPTQSTTDGFDFYFMGLDSNASQLKYGSYFGGGLSQEHVDGGTSRFDPAGRIYQSACAGCQANDDFPVTPGAWPNTPGDPNHVPGNVGCNNGVVKLDFQLQVSVSTIATNTLQGCSPLTLTFNNQVPSSNPTSTYMWYLGNGTTTSLVANPVVTYSVPGTYTVSLVVKDVNTCNRKDSVINFVTVYPKPVSTIVLSANPCTNTVQVSNTTAGSLGTNPYVWNFGDGTPSSTLSALTHTYITNGAYTLSLTTTDLNGCTNVATNTISVFNFTTGVVNSASVCAGLATTITASGGTSYTWSPAGSLDNPSAAAPVANPLATTVYTVQIANNSSGYNCVGTLTTQLTVKPGPIADFNISTNPCSNVITTTNTTTGTLTATSYHWNFGDGSPLVTTPSPNYTYPGNGTYTISLTATDQNGCINNKTYTLAIFNFTPGIVSSASICSGFTTAVIAEGGTNYTWTPAGSLDNGSIGSPVASPTVTTIYTVEILNTTPGYNCSRTLTTQVLVKPSPVVGFNYNVNPCGGGVYFYDQSGSDVTNWQWALTPVLTSTVQNPYHFYTAGGTYTVSLESTNSVGCKNKTSKVISILTPPTLSVSNSASICISSSVQLNASGGTAYQWTPSQSLDFPAMANPVANPTITTNYSVNITTASTNSATGQPCKFLLTTLVNVFNLSTIPVSAQANPVLVTAGNITTLTYFGSPGATVTWFPIGATTPLTGYTVTAQPVTATTYTARATNGPCAKDITVAVDAYSEGCLDKDVFIPNTFTPNSDGQNDLLYVRGLKVTDVYFAIYNRWGEMIFETTDKTKGWDGTYKGKAVDVGVFGWYLKVTCFNGEQTFKKGNVTVVR